MNAESYALLAEVYDAFSDPEGDAEIIEQIHEWFRRYLPQAPESKLIDLGCGTGRLTLPLAKSFHQTEAIDLSPEMLAIFRARLEPRDKISLIHANILEVDSSPADVVISLTDTINHLSPEELQILLRRLSDLTVPGGLFIFDLLKRDYLASERGDHCFYSELGGADETETCFVWENDWDEESAIANSYFTFFKRDEQSGLYRRELAELSEYFHDFQTLCEVLGADWTVLEENSYPERSLYLLQRNH